MTREEFFKIYAGIRYWRERCCIEKANTILRFLYDSIETCLNLDSLKAEQADDQSIEAAQTELDLRMLQLQASISQPDIDDIPDDAEPVCLGEDDFKIFMQNEAIGDTSPITREEKWFVSVELFVQALILNDVEDLTIASQALSDVELPKDHKLYAKVTACRAYMAFQDNHDKEAERLFLCSLEAGPDEADTYLLRAFMAFSLGHHDKALADIEHAEMLRKNDVLIMSVHGDIAFELRQVDTALRLHGSVIERCPTLRRSLLSLAIINLETQNHEAAYNHLCVLLRNEPLNWFAHGCMGDIYMMTPGKTFRALACYAMAIISGTDEPNIGLNAIRLLMYMGKYEEALALNRELFATHEQVDPLNHRFPVHRLTKCKKEFQLLELICEIITDPMTFNEAPERLSMRLGALQANKMTALLISLLLDYASLDYCDDLTSIIKRSLSGLDALTACIKGGMNQSISTDTMVLLTAVIRMAIWNGFYAEARSFINMLDQIDEAPLRDAISLLENEAFVREAMARKAGVDIPHLHYLMLDGIGADFKHALEQGSIKNSDIKSNWRMLMAGCMGLQNNHDIRTLFIDAPDPTPFKKLIACSTENTFKRLATAIRESTEYLQEHLDRSWEENKDAIKSIIASDRNPFPPTSPEAESVLVYMQYWFEHTCAQEHQNKQREKLKPLLQQIRADIECKEQCSWDADNDNTVDPYHPIPEYFMIVQRPKYFDDTSLNKDHATPFTEPIVEVNACQSRVTLQQLASRYAMIFARTTTNEQVFDEMASRHTPRLANAITQRLLLLHGVETHEEFMLAHQNKELYEEVTQVLAQLTPELRMIEYRQTLSSWRNDDSDSPLLPPESLPSPGAVMRFQQPPEYPFATDLLRQPVCGNLITWHDLREMFHNYAVCCIESALENDDPSSLEIFFDSENLFAFNDFANPKKRLTDVSLMLNAIKSCRDSKQPPAPFSLFFGSGTATRPFCKQFDTWAEQNADHLLKECFQVEHAVFHLNQQNEFETRCRIQSILNHYPFLSRIYILQAALLGQRKDAQGAMAAIKKGIEWEDKLYRGVGWKPINPTEDGLHEKPLEPLEMTCDADLPYKIWNETMLNINQDTELVYCYGAWNTHFEMRRRYPYKFPQMFEREMNFDKAGAFDFYRLFSNFIKILPHLEQTYLRALATPGLTNLHEYMRYMLFNLDSNESYEFHRQLSELMLQIYPLEDATTTAHFCSDNGFAINAMFHAARSYVLTTPNNCVHDAHEAAEVIGASLYDLGYIDEATFYLSFATLKPSSTPQALLTLGCALIENQKYKKAIEILEKGKKLDPYNDRFYFNLALAYIEKSKFKLAEQCLREGLCVSHAPFDIGIQLLRAILKQDHIHEAIELAKVLNKADHDMFVEAMRAIEFEPFTSLQAIRTMLDW